MLFLRFFFKATWWLITLALLPTSTLLSNIFRQYIATYLRWNPTPLDFSIANALRSEYTGLERLIDDRHTLISPLSHNMHLGSATMDQIITTIRSSSIDGADALARTFSQLSADATAIGKKLQAYSASIDSTVDEALSHSSVLGNGLRQQTSVSFFVESTCKALPSFVFAPHSCKQLREVPLFFLRFLDNLESRVLVLIEHANDLDRALADFGTQLRVISIIAEGEMRAALEGERMTKNGFWTRLGGNKGDLATFDRNIGTLQRALEYHAVAKRCLSATQESLEGMLSSLKELRPLTNKSNAHSSGLALEAILMQITLGMERIKDRLGGRRLEGDLLKKESPTTPGVAPKRPVAVHL
ncbi:hypothetical protein BDM02DRAFT_3131936 [Thelephora ganbajun]|uniref:Uncharacterized protein n=1 Tax=Thelephora ganbajun TaxID=370292 RepID=A0ACB6Z325_THEGA|nr:hypothetical protein BDM02DRAFT_3131936 [Thelephora ganbajun]